MEHSGDRALRWLLIEGLLPLAGAGVLYLIWGWARYINAKNKSRFIFAWKEALDPFGWLYGGGILCVQLVIKALAKGGFPFTLAFLAVEGFVCTILLIAAMNERGQDPTWKPPKSLTAIAGALLIAILAQGFLVYHGD